MLLKYFYDEALAHASYLVGCQRSGEAVVVDPGRDIEGYLERAANEGLRITAVAETHIHADYVSGARELADRINAKLYISDEGPAEWKYEFLRPYPHQLLHDGDQFKVGNLRFDVLATPGHTPESISFLLTDVGGGADEPMGIFTGDFIFVGSIGRPDLLEEAAKLANTAEPGARDLYRSVQRFVKLPDHLQVWPAHGAGSACGKGLGAIPSSTVGYEKRFNPALQFDDQERFVRYILADQPEAPSYFAVMKRVNKEGPLVLGKTDRIVKLDAKPWLRERQTGTVVDLRPSEAFSAGHLRGTINIPLSLLASWAGWLVDYDRPLTLIGSPEQMPEALRVLRKIGVEQISGFVDWSELSPSADRLESYQSISPDELETFIAKDEVLVLDVRSAAELEAGRIPGATHAFLGRLPKQAESLSKQQRLALYCQSGARSAIAVSVLKACGFQDVLNVTGGYPAWQNACQTEPGCAVGR